MRRWFLLSLGAAGLCLAATPSQAGPFNRCRGGHGGDGGGAVYAAPAADACAWVTEARTVMVPEMVTEMQKRMVTEYRSENRTRTVTRYRMVPVTQEVPFSYTVMDTRYDTRIENYTELVAVTEPKTITWTVMVPHTEERKGTRRVARCVEVEEPRQVTRDMGRFEERLVTRPAAPAVVVSCDSGKRHGLLGRLRGHGKKGDCCVEVHCTPACDDACGDGGPAMVTTVERVWVPNLVTSTEKVKVSRVEYVEEPYTYTVTVCRPEERSQTVQVTRCVPTPRTREVKVAVCVPRVVNTTRTVTTCRSEPFEAVEHYTVCVPVQVEREVAVRVCRMVERTVHVRVPAPAAPCDGAAPAHGSGGHHH
jgi:hypothetical protein